MESKGAIVGGAEGLSDAPDGVEGESALPFEAKTFVSAEKGSEQEISTQEDTTALDVLTEKDSEVGNVVKNNISDTMQVGEMPDKELVGFVQKIVEGTKGDPYERMEQIKAAKNDRFAAGQGLELGGRG